MLPQNCTQIFTQLILKWVLYLAPYSPEDNPIEHYWPRIKNKARQNAEYYYNFRDAVDHALVTT